MSFRQTWCYALCASFLMLVPVQGQIPKSILASRTNADATSPRDATAGASALAAGCANGICYHGGPVMLGAPTVYYIWYGNWAANGIPNGNHTVALGFDETVVSSSGLRVFNVIINGQTVLANFDIFQTAGFGTAIIQSFPVSVSGSQVVIQVTALTAARPPRVNIVAIQ
jgi:hypothetical protein